MRMKDFKNKEKLKNHVKYKLNNTYSLYDVIKRGAFFELLLELVNNHHNGKEKIGGGVESFTVAQCDYNPKKRRFIGKRKDGGVFEFSYLKCISGKRPSQEKEVKDALRVSVSDFIRDFKQDYFNAHADSKGYIKCEITGLKMLWKNTHADHVYPYTFDSLFYRFFSDYKIDVNSIKVGFEKTSTGGTRRVILDEDIDDLFYRWHAKNAKLRCIYFRANLQHKKTKDFNGEKVELRKVEQNKVDKTSFVFSDTFKVCELCGGECNASCYN